MNKIILTFILLISIYGSNSFGQLPDFIRNETVNYRVCITGLKFLDSNKVKLRTTFIEVFMSDSARKEVLKISYEKWMQLLSNKNTDWAANLYLWDIYKRETTDLVYPSNRSSWIKCCKVEDVYYWKKYLRQTNKY